MTKNCPVSGKEAQYEARHSQPSAHTPHTPRTDTQGTQTHTQTRTPRTPPAKRQGRAPRHGRQRPPTRNRKKSQRPNEKEGADEKKGEGKERGKQCTPPPEKQSPAWFYVHVCSKRVMWPVCSKQTKIRCCLAFGYVLMIIPHIILECSDDLVMLHFVQISFSNAAHTPVVG